MSVAGEPSGAVDLSAALDGDLSLPRVLSAVALLGAIQVILPRTSPVHSALFLVVTFFAVGGHFVLLNAQFLAAVHILVYAGAIMVLFLFVLMLLNQHEPILLKRPALGWLAGGTIGGLVLVALLASIPAEGASAALGPDRGIGLVERIGRTLFSDFRAPFELASMLFLAAIIGVVLLSRKEKARAPEPTE
jgi:NADH-quinone oxidoreductase subunit J